MPHDRFYIDAPLKGDVTLTGTELHHLTRVMRRKVGDTVDLINGKRVIAQGTIRSLSKWEATITIVHTTTQPPQMAPLILIQALPKIPKLEFILQKGTELGVSEFYIYPSTHSDKHTLSETQHNRLKHITIGAMKQCGRLDLPDIHWGFPSITIPLFFGDVRPNAPSLTHHATLPGALLIGPEKGFSIEEVQDLDQRGVGVRIAPYTLRTETAAIAGLTLMAASSL